VSDKGAAIGQGVSLKDRYRVAPTPTVALKGGIWPAGEINGRDGYVRETESAAEKEEKERQRLKRARD